MADSAQELPSTAKAPLVSVVIPAYNAAEYIAGTLESVFTQVFTDYEVILINDGSPDATELERALQPYRSRIRYLEQENRGPSGARNTGIRAARGKYIALLDGDDLWLPQHLANQVALIENEPGFDLVYSNGVHIVGDRPVGISFEITPQALPVNFDTLLRETCTVNTSSVLAVREVMLRAGLFDETMRRCEDYDLWLRMAYAGARMTFTRRIQIGHRLANGLAGDYDAMKQALIHVYEKTVATRKLSDEQLQSVRAKIASISTALHFERAKGSLLQGDFERARASLAAAQAAAPHARTKLMALGLGFSPRTLRALYRLHLQYVQRKKKLARKRSLERAGIGSSFRNLAAVARPSRAAEAGLFLHAAQQETESRTHA
jgi:glycosyltransferase involved in cell wall biosynthesis